jgi:hypothetical protein
MDLASTFPPFGLRVVCGDLELRLPDDAELLRLNDVAVAGVHPPERKPFLFPWNVGEPDEVRCRLLQYHWSSRGKVSPEAWALELGVFRDGEPIGVTRALGYAPNGVVLHDRQGAVATENRYRMTREAWAARPEAHRPDVTLEGVAPVRAMLKMDDAA